MKVENIKTICNLGTGTMGFGTAVMFAMAGYHVKMYGRSDKSVDRGFAGVKAALATYQENGLVKAADIPAIIAKIEGVTTLEEAAADADFVIESIAEELPIKQEVFTKLDKICRPHTIFATNTSGLSPTKIAEAIGRKDKFVVAHFWNPPHIVPLVEVVPGKHTSQETVDVTWQLMEKIGKKPVALNREALGFIGNRLQLALLREALYIVESGIASKEAVDTTMKYSLGRRLSTTGPLESTDLGGLDIFYNISGYLLEDLCNDTKISPLLKAAVEQGKLGAKTGEGFYTWTPEALAKIKKTRETILLEWLHKDKKMEF
ncbi:3-hydroxyacyl-CoA dehydrogenase family protein [Sporomusa sphaeroides]|uniref:L-gulonate 3-dehydrogenase n=1 Tax=Sporomusa sphaeroides DSM 2875 TaxID=1337886 RepID=A0ABM9W4Z6_9FIRM|nr:3-hydroxyacyl-CoA dehydrogenase family protein [Sporomusa sphaeroides]OLS56028.1 putative 3-hydroxybutyryl-CoA dehydrogenase [Sporomusa sphaeroides DSM 2875]CVK20239.1 putative 3-hydroxybutyryl-CoA dehydrogenase [Sporomusa sphaeroides DSM 2875]